MKSIKILIWINAVMFLLYGIGFMFFPEALSTWVTDSIPGSSSGLIDMRATYGGISLGLGILMILATRKTETLELGAWSVILIVGGMALGRLTGIMIDDSPNNVMYLFLVLEIIVVGMMLFLLSRNKK